MPHFHLSLQAGDDMILKRMKRRHLRADTIKFCEDVRKMRPDVVFGADIIAGFPTETEEMFEFTQDRRRMRSDPSPRLPVFAPSRHTSGAHAAAAAQHRQGTWCAFA
jgi:tRNA A37 methylthiotransferase MiaB